MTAKELRQYYNSETFEKEYYYEGSDLGAFCGNKGTAFRVWSPVAEQIRLNLYRDGGEAGSGSGCAEKEGPGNGCAGEPPAGSPQMEKKYTGTYPRIVEMKRWERGVWIWECPENLDGIYYDFDVLMDEKWTRTADPYARACGVNGVRSMVIDLARTNPEGWETDRAPEREAEDIIYELHVKEFSWDKAAGVPEEYRGKYMAFTCKDTVLNGDEAGCGESADGEKGCGYPEHTRPTGVSYLRKLGVNHIQLMPVYDYGSVDEAGDPSEFNWGYDPVNYNVPEGSYATDAAHGEVRIRELKELVNSLHEQGFRVIMDVVYNHTYSLDSNLQKMVPWYYYRQNEDGTPSNGSACGNDVASERAMCGKYILDSVLYWTEEYHMDGYRFDLMGLLDVGLMNGIQEELDKRYGVGEKLIYGEPWAADKTPMKKGHMQALKKNIRHMNKNIGMFCDSTRDAVKGHVFKEEIPGFVNGASGLEEQILNGVTAWCEKNEEFQALAPSQILNYISAHDNLTLWDKLVKTMSCQACLSKDPVDVHLGEKEEYHVYPEDIVKANKLAAAIYFTCQGRIFMLSGEEFARTKEGLENSFNASAEINRIDWNRAYERTDLREYYRGLIALRKKIPGLCDKSEDAKERIRNKKIRCEGCVSFYVENEKKTAGADMEKTVEECPWSQLFVCYNSGKAVQEMNLEAGAWQVLVDGESSRKWMMTRKTAEVVSGTVTVRPGTAVILGRQQGV